MAYITLNEIKEILPEIMRDWIDKDDESWEWIFQEIEQKCHVGKKKKDKKPKKKDMQNAMEIAIMAHRNDINECNRKITNLSDVYTEKVQQMQLTINDLRAEVMHLRSEITAAKSMAETAKQRTEVDYSKYSGKSDGKISYCNPEDIDQWRNEHESDRSRFNNKCASCKHIRTEPYDQPCIGCCYNGMNISGMDKWEAKDNE